MKPVAWTDGKFCLSFAESDVCPIPLYTAPRELSDEDVVIPRELAENYLKITEIPRYKRILEDALKKASEK